MIEVWSEQYGKECTLRGKELFSSIEKEVNDFLKMPKRIVSLGAIKDRLGIYHGSEDYYVVWMSDENCKVRFGNLTDFAIERLYTEGFEVLRRQSSNEWWD